MQKLINPHAKELKATFNKQGRRLADRVLDVGSREGNYFSLFRELGAETIFACDPKPREEELKENMRSSFVPEKNFYKIKVEEMPASFYGTFDYALMLNACIDASDRLGVFQGIMKLLKKAGSELIVTIAENTVAYDYMKSAGKAGFEVLGPYKVVHMMGDVEIAYGRDHQRHRQDYAYPNENILIARPMAGTMHLRVGDKICEIPIPSC